MTLDIPPVDMLFIDSLHTYCHLTCELEKFSPKVGKYIAMHDTSAPWGMMDDDQYHGDYSEYEPSFDRTKRGLWPAVVDFLGRHPEWSLYQRNLYSHGFTVLGRTEAISGGASVDAKVEEALQNRIILCTGPALNRKAELKAMTENDLKQIPFKKIFLSTNDPDNIDVTFKGHAPIFGLLPCYGYQVDCINSIISSIRNVVNDPACQDEDIILFKEDSVFINDMGLVRKAIGKILEGYDAVTRFSDLDMTDVFFIKVSAARELFQDRRRIRVLDGYYNCEDYFTREVFNRLPGVYRIQLNRINRHWEHNELGFFHVFPQTVKDRLFWDKENYDALYR
jgi:hypothetical protein